MSAPQAAAITACTACAAVGGAAAGGAFSSVSAVDNEDHTHDIPKEPTESETSKQSKATPEEEPKWYPVSEEESTNKSEFTDELIGKVYEKYLVGSYGSNDKSNESWWSKSYKKYDTDQKVSDTSGKRTFSTEFSTGKVTAAFQVKTPSSGVVDTTLNKVCYKIYKQNKSTIVPPSGTGDNNTKLRDDLWRYCSPLGETPVFADHSTNGENIGNGKVAHTKKTTLLSTKDNINTLLWKLKHDEFYALSNVTDAFFKDLFGNNKATNKAKENSFRDKCKEGYKVDSSSSGDTTNNPTAEILEKYCSLKSMTEN